MKKLEPQWQRLLQAEFNQPYMKELRQFLVAQAQENKVIYPPSKEIFAAFDLTPFDCVKVVILGQDPYINPKQAHGLCFSVRKDSNTPIPPSLKNIFKELESDLNIPASKHGDLSAWAKQGVLLLNDVLTVEHGESGSHQNKGWEKFTLQVVQKLNEEKKNLVFILWGQHAKLKGSFIDTDKHCVIASSHPSPFSAKNFYGHRPFSRCNAYLESKKITPINWQLED